LKQISRSNIRRDVFRQQLKLIEFPSDPFLSTDDLETGIETFTNTLRSAKIAGQVNRPHEAIKHFPDLSELVAKKRQIRKRFQRCRQRADKMELNRLTNLIHNKIRGIETFTNTLRSAKIAGQVNRPHEAIKHFPDLSDLVAKKRQIRKRWQGRRQRADKIELNRLTNLIHSKIREFHIQKLEKDVQTASESGTIWKMANRIRGSRTTDSPPIQGRDRVRYEAQGKATAVTDSIEDQFRPNDSEPEFRNHYRLVRNGVQQLRNINFDTSIQSVSGNEVRNIIKQLKVNKASGHDIVNNSMLKQLPCHCITNLVAIFNNALKLQYFPDIGKKANVVTLPKPGKDPKIPSNRRPINLLSSLGIIYERIVLNRL